MKNFDNNQAVVVLIVMFVFGFAGPSAALVATTPSLGAAATYGVLSNIYTDTSGLTTVNGDIGFNVEPTTSVAGTHTNYGSGDPYSAAGIDQNNALSILNNHACTYTYTNGPIDISTNASRPGSTPGVFMPGVYCSIGAMNIGGPLTLSGNGTYIFKPLGALTSTNGSVVTLSGASACDVFWVPINETVLGANTTFAGTIIGNDANIFIGANTTFLGRALSFSRTVTTNTDTLTVPTCGAVPTPTPTPTTATQSSSASSSGEGYINIVKTVINDSGGTKTVTDFPLFVNGTQVGSGITNTFPAPAGIYTVTETGDANYVKTYSGACDVNGQLNLNPGDIKLCIITNDDIAAIVLPPPLIDVLKVPNPLALPNGPGPVTYTYTLRNIGIVPVTNVTMVGDTCS
ncbi:MAG: ice-binding family protein, partial [bacterium]|nr:ice-binding family protein [bacterium]